MATVREIAASFEQRVPTSMKMDFDNPGFLVGNGDTEVTKVLFSLDITDEVIAEAKEVGAQLIMSHHPLFFSVKDANTDTLIGRKIVAMLSAGISCICLHTNLDAVVGGVNDALMAVLGIPMEGILEPYGEYVDGKPYGMGRYGYVSERSLQDFLPQVKTALNCNGLRYISGGKPVHKVAVCGGSGSSLLEEVKALGCDTFITGDVKHNGFLDARDMEINLIDAGHFSTENVVIPVLEQMLKQDFPGTETYISQVHTQPEQYYV